MIDFASTLQDIERRMRADAAAFLTRVANEKGITEARFLELYAITIEIAPYDFVEPWKLVYTIRAVPIPATPAPAPVRPVRPPFGTPSGHPPPSTRK